MQISLYCTNQLHYNVVTFDMRITMPVHGKGYGELNASKCLKTYNDGRNLYAMASEHNQGRGKKRKQTNGCP
jgi:hypothetical protein